MNLLTVIPTCADDAPLAEKLLDWIYILNCKRAYGPVALAYAADLHSEMRTKLKISADLAFESVMELSLPALKRETATKTEHINHTFKHTSAMLASVSRWAWLWLEPDCVPVAPHWLDMLSLSYNNQPMRYMGAFMKQMTENNPLTFMGRVGIYAPTAASDIGAKFCDSIVPFERFGAQANLPRSRQTKLIQQLVYDGDETKIREGTFLLHSDKSGSLIDLMRHKNIPASGNGNPVEVKIVPSPEVPADPAAPDDATVTLKKPRKKREPYLWQRT